MSLADVLPPRGSAGSRRLEARAGGVLIIVGGLVSLSMASLDPRPIVNVVAGVLGLVFGAFAILVPTPERWPHGVYVFIALSVTAMVSSVPASIHRPGDLGTGPVFYMWIVMHSSIFMSRRESRAVAAWASVIYVGIVAVELPVTEAIAAGVTMVLGLAALQVVTAWLRDGIDDLVARMKAQAEHDALTGLLNRQGLVDHIERARADGAFTSGVLLILDVDHFKQINDRFGHAAGDDTLAWLGSVLDATAAGSAQLPALAARFGGEEFVVWLDGATAAEGEAWAERLRTAVLESSVTRQRPLAVTVSIGVAAGETEDFTGLLNRADHALYRAKESGRNRVRVAPSGAP